MGSGRRYIDRGPPACATSLSVVFRPPSLVIGGTGWAQPTLLRVRPQFGIRPDLGLVDLLMPFRNEIEQLVLK